MSVINNDPINNQVIKPLGQKNTVTHSSPDKSPDSNNNSSTLANNLSGLQNLRASIRNDVSSTTNNISQSNISRTQNINSANASHAESSNASNEASAQNTIADDLDVEIQDKTAQAKDKKTQAKSAPCEIAEQLKQEAKQLQEEAKIKDYEMQKARNEAEVFEELASKYSAQSTESTNAANTDKRNADSSTTQIAALNSQDTDVSTKISTSSQNKNNRLTSNTPSSLRGAAAQNAPQAQNAPGGGKTPAALVVGDDVDLSVIQNPYLAVAEGVRSALAGLVNAARSATESPVVQSMFSFAKKTLAQLGKSATQAGMAQETNSASSESFKLRLLDGMFIAEAGNAEESLKYHEERGKQSYIEGPKKTNDMIKPA